MVIRRLFASIGALATATLAAGCYDSNCEFRHDCPALDDAPETETDAPADTGTTIVIEAPEAPKPQATAANENPEGQGYALDVLTGEKGGFCLREAGTIDEGCGVFVSSSKGQDDYPGTRKKPLRTLQHALNVAAKGTHAVFACAEEFEEDVILPAGVHLIGGLDCQGEEWESIGWMAKTAIRATAPGKHALVAESASWRSIVVDVRMEALDAVVPGGSSVAAVTWDGSKVLFVSCEFVTGDAKRGADGAPGDPNAPVAKGGPNGLMGAGACSADAPAGGNLVFTICDDGVMTLGGIGGKGGSSQGADGTMGLPEPQPNLDATGMLGAGETSGALCVAGAEGSPGLDGVHGLGAKGLGAMSINGYEGKNGGDGTHGTVGQGGGGGGGSRGGLVFCGNKPKGGAGGGSGGAGGCGGRGGRGGGYGGASIGLVIGNSEVEVTDGVFLIGDGGDGGTGGMFQIGGAGGVEGTGGLGTGGSLNGCFGGPGGRGGNGGYGGGGLGGHSVAVVHKLEEPDIDFEIVSLGKPGKGGYGGNPYDDTLRGGDGIVLEMLVLPETP